MIFSLSYISVLFTKKESLKKCKDFTKTGAVQDDFEHFYQKLSLYLVQSLVLNIT